MGLLAKRLAALGVAGVLLTGGVFIAGHEGYVPGTYVDPAGVLTACYGHTHPGLSERQTISDGECLEILAVDLRTHYDELAQAVKVPLSDQEQVAYLSFHYNVGGSAFRQSTLLTLLNAGDREAACNELPRWVFAGGKRLRGLEQRRLAEQTMCLEGVASANQTYAFDDDSIDTHHLSSDGAAPADEDSNTDAQSPACRCDCPESATPVGDIRFNHQPRAKRAEYTASAR